MKKIIFYTALLLIIIQSLVYAQTNNVQSAANELKYKNFGDAKTYIDKAAEHPTTANDPKMWFYRGKIYLAIHADTLLTVNNLDNNAAEKAVESFINCLKTDKKGMHKEECQKLVIKSGVMLYNKGVKAYNYKDYQTSINAYNKIFDIIPFDTEKGLIRSNISIETLYHRLYLATLEINDKEKAKTYLIKLIEMAYNDPAIYIDISKILTSEKDTSKALEYLEKGRSIFNENITLMNVEANIYLSQGKLNELIEKTSESIKQDPEYEMLYLYRGFLNEKANETKKAEEDYLKVIEIKPQSFDAVYNLGVLYFNTATNLNNEANNLKSNTEFLKAQEEVKLHFNKSQPYLEKALELNPSDRNTLNSLKQLYAKTSQQEKYNEIKQKLEKL